MRKAPSRPPVKGDMKYLGIDIGGTGVKGAVVDTKKGVFVTDRLRFETPRPATPEALAPVVGQIVRHFDWDGRVGCTFPGVVMQDHIHTAANLHQSWIGIDAAKLFGKAMGGLHVSVMNDADAAGVAEQAFGAAMNDAGVIQVITLGTGIGSALIHNGNLVPNTEFGHLQLHGADAEIYASEIARERDKLGWEEWAERLSEYFQLVENLVWPDLFVVGGGISKEPDPWLPLIQCRTKIVTARLRNKAGIIGAALQAERRHNRAGRRGRLL
jgi:polyphosphate glucokinase